MKKEGVCFPLRVMDRVVPEMLCFLGTISFLTIGLLVAVLVYLKVSFEARASHIFPPRPDRSS